MVTKNPRVNVTFEEQTLGMLGSMAKADQKSVSGLVKELTLEALERREDYMLSRLAERRDKITVHTVSHDVAWK